jgi:CHAD domain-containing protein
LKSADADAVHDLRVKIRRLNQAQSVFSAKEQHKLRSSLKKLMKLAGAVRDRDITLELTSESKWASAALRSGFAAERQDAERVLLKSLKRWLTHNNAASRIALRPAAFGESARHALRSIARKFFARGARAANGATPQELHKFRIAAKKFRYTLELFAPVLGSGLNVWMERIKDVQSRLGEINDYETARRMVAGLVSEGSAPDGSGKVAADLERRQRAKVKEFHKLWTAEVARTWKRSLLPGLLDPTAGPEAPGLKSATASSSS